MNPVDAIIQEVRMSLVPVTLEDGSKKVTINCNGDRFDPYSIHASVSEKNAIRAVANGEDDVRALLRKTSPKALETTAKKIRDDNQRYYSAKIRLTKIAFKISNGTDLLKLMEFIDKVCVAYRYVGNRNRVYINPTTHLRLADETGWDSRGKLHLQKVVTLDGGNMLFHNYPRESEEELLEEVIPADIF